MKPEIIAELAQGFEGRPEQARLLVKAAANAGADAAKFQLVYADEVATPDYKYYNLFKSLEMADEIWENLATYASELRISLHLDIFGIRSLKLAERIGVDTIKLHPTDISNIGLLEEVAESSLQRVLLGVGGAYANEIQLALKILSKKHIVLLLGFQGYPTENSANHINRLPLLIRDFVKTYPNVSVGFADHASPDCSLKYLLAAIAIGSGAKVIEKHLTLGRVMKLEDHESALNPDEFAEFSKIVRDCAEAFGESKDTNDYGMNEAELGYRKLIRRHVITKGDIIKGSIISPTDVTLKRSSCDNAITDLSLVYNKTLKHEILKNIPITLMDID